MYFSSASLFGLRVVRRMAFRAEGDWVLFAVLASMASIPAMVHLAIGANAHLVLQEYGDSYHDTPNNVLSRLKKHRPSWNNCDRI